MRSVAKNAKKKNTRTEADEVEIDAEVAVDILH